MGAGPRGLRTIVGQLIIETCNKVYCLFNKRKKRGRKAQQGPQSPTATKQATIIIGRWASQRWKIGKKANKGLTTSKVVELA